MISVEQTQTIHLGRTGEQDVTEIVFNIAPWIAQFGQGNVLLNVKRACDTIPYPANIVVVENTAVWTVSKKDVESYGTGKAELTYMVDDKIKKSVVYKTYTEKSLADITPTPENGDSWLDAMTKQVLKAEGHSTQAESYAHGGTGARADENTDNAKYYSEQADLDAQTTDADRQVVEQAKTEVLENAKEVGLNKQAVENVAKNVTDAEVRIGKAEDDIKLMQTDVKANKDTTEKAKQDAEQAVTHYPKIVDGYWYVWDVNAQAFVKNVKAEGPQGKTGPQGLNGKDGATGPQGPQGMQGEKGEQGIQGEKGLTGDVGPQGPIGPKGDTGPQGDIGPIGPSVPVDAEMSDVSENPVQNKVVKQYVDDLKEKKWELIDTVTVKEPAKILLNKESDGTKYRFKNISATISYEGEEKLSYVQLNVKTNYSTYYGGGEFLPSQNNWLCILLLNIGGSTFLIRNDMSHEKIPDFIKNVIISGPKKFPNQKGNEETVLEISTTVPVPTGTVITVWGCR